MASKQHGSLDTSDGLHGIIASDVANAAALPATGDVGTVRRTTSTHDLHVLIGASPTVWKRIAWGEDLDTCTAAAAAAQTTANTAVTNAAAAQTTANTAVTNAAAAQTTANGRATVASVTTAQAAADAAQTTANTAVTNAATAQTAANSKTTLAAANDQTPVTSSSTAITLGAAHLYKPLRCTAATTITVSGPSDANEPAIPIGGFGSIEWRGVGQPVFAAGAGASVGGTKLKVIASEQSMKWTKISANTYEVTGATST